MGNNRLVLGLHGREIPPGLAWGDCFWALEQEVAKSVADGLSSGIRLCAFGNGNGNSEWRWPYCRPFDTPLHVEDGGKGQSFSAAICVLIHTFRAEGDRFTPLKMGSSDLFQSTPSVCGATNAEPAPERGLTQMSTHANPISSASDTRVPQSGQTVKTEFAISIHAHVD